MVSNPTINEVNVIPFIHFWHMQHSLISHENNVFMFNIMYGTCMLITKDGQ